MPELPEVEMARENLLYWLKNRRISGVRVLDRRMLRGQSVKRLEQAVTGARLRGVRRRGKYLIWDLGRRGQIMAHLGMSGKFVVRSRREPDPPAARVVLSLGKGERVVFSDLRRLGRFQLIDDKLRRSLAQLGVEPLSEEFTSRRLGELLAGARTPIKSFLLDQHRVAGVGNIHASEALFRAGIHPTRIAGELLPDEIGRLRRAIRATLDETLGRERATEVRYLQERRGENRFVIYDREKEPCPRCSARVRRLVQAGRSTYYCPRCQPTPRRRRSLDKRQGKTIAKPRRRPGAGKASLRGNL